DEHRDRAAGLTHDQRVSTVVLESRPHAVFGEPGGEVALELRDDIVERESMPRRRLLVRSWRRHRAMVVFVIEEAEVRAFETRQELRHDMRDARNDFVGPCFGRERDEEARGPWVRVHRQDPGAPTHATLQLTREIATAVDHRRAQTNPTR